MAQPHVVSYPRLWGHCPRWGWWQDVVSASPTCFLVALFWPTWCEAAALLVSQREIVPQVALDSWVPGRRWVQDAATSPSWTAPHTKVPTSCFLLAFSQKLLHQPHMVPRYQRGESKQILCHSQQRHLSLHLWIVTSTCFRWTNAASRSGQIKCSNKLLFWINLNWDSKDQIKQECFFFFFSRCKYLNVGNLEQLFHHLISGLKVLLYWDNCVVSTAWHPFLVVLVSWFKLAPVVVVGGWRACPLTLKALPRICQCSAFNHTESNL